MFSKYRVSFSADIQKTLTQFPHLGTRRGKPKRGLSFCGGRAGGAARRPLPPLQELLKSCPQQGSPPGSCHSTCPLCQHRGQIYLDLTVLDSTVVGAQRFTQQSARVGLGCSPAEALRCGCLRSFCSLTSAQAAQLLPMHPSHALLLCRVAICRYAVQNGGPHGTAGSMLMECGLQKHSDVDARGRSATCAWLELPNFLRSLRATCRCSTAWLRVQLSVKWSPDGQSQFMPGECSPPIITRTRSCPL